MKWSLRYLGSPSMLDLGIYIILSGVACFGFDAFHVHDYMVSKYGYKTRSFDFSNKTFTKGLRDRLPNPSQRPIHLC